MKILYIGEVSGGSTNLMQVAALRRLGHEVVTVDMFGDLAHYGRVGKALHFAFSSGPAVTRFNRAVFDRVEEVRPNLIWVSKGVWLRRSTIRETRRRVGSDAFWVHYNPDDPFGGYRKGWRTFLKALPLYDAHVVSRDQNVAELRALTKARVLRMEWAFDPAVHRPYQLTTEEMAALGGPVGFIGTFETARANSIMFLARNGVGVRVWGEGWARWQGRHQNVRIENRAVWAADYARCVASFDINLGFLRKGNRDQSTQRSMEVPACRGFLLAERTAEHQRLFSEGKELELFGDDEELLGKTLYYLANPEARRAVAAAAYRRSISSGYTYFDRLGRVLEQLGLPTPERV